MDSTKRLNWIWRGLLSLLVLAALAFTAHSASFSGASFTARSTDTPSVIVVGDLSHTNDAGGQIMIDASGLMPGTGSAGTMTLTSTGTLIGDFSLGVSSLTNTPTAPRLSDVLVLTVQDVDAAAVLYSGSVSELPTVSLGAIAPGVARSYRLTLTYPPGPNNASLQGADMTLGLQITGVSR